MAKTSLQHVRNFLFLLVFLKHESYKSLYGPCKASSKKIEAVNLFLNGKSFQEIARALRVAVATAEVYTIDGYRAGAPLEFDKLCSEMNITYTDRVTVCNGIKTHGTTLRNIRDQFQDRYTYNQIRLVLAAMIRDDMH